MNKTRCTDIYAQIHSHIHDELRKHLRKRGIPLSHCTQDQATLYIARELDNSKHQSHGDSTHAQTT
jgi:hypothetical protein